MSKMDSLASRTTADLERRYQFGKSFAELEGIALDAQTHAAEAERIANQVKLEFQSLDIDVVEKLNASADIITLNSNRLAVNSDYFSLTAEGLMSAKRGIIGKWDISENGISKSTANYFVKITSPEADNDDVITVSKIGNGLVTEVPFCLKADGRFFSKNGEIAGFNLMGNGFEYVKSEDPDEYGLYTVDKVEYTTEHVLCETRFMDHNTPMRVASTKITSTGLMYSLTGGDILASNEISFATLEQGSGNYIVYADLNDMTVKVRSMG